MFYGIEGAGGPGQYIIPENIKISKRIDKKFKLIKNWNIKLKFKTKKMVFFGEKIKLEKYYIIK